MSRLPPDARLGPHTRVRVVRPPGIDPECIQRVLRVAPEHAGMRVDVFVQSQLRNTSRTRARVIVEKSGFTPDGRALRASERLAAEDRVVLWRPPWDETVDDLELPVLYEDEHLFAIDKPPLLAVHPSARYFASTVIKRLQAARPGQFVSLLHRLDRETSGVLLVAKTPRTDSTFKRALELRDGIEKTYLAITWGVPPEGLVNRALEVDGDNPLRVKMRVADETGLDARTDVTVLHGRAGYALVRARLLTGRQHQIRVHLASLGCPVVGDKLYGPDERMLARAADGELTDEDRARLELPRHALHAHRYELQHPITGAPLAIEAPLPEDLAAFWEGLGEPEA